MLATCNQMLLIVMRLRSSGHQNSIDTKNLLHHKYNFILDTNLHFRMNVVPWLTRPNISIQHFCVGVPEISRVVSSERAKYFVLGGIVSSSSKVKSSNVSYQSPSSIDGVRIICVTNDSFLMVSVSS